MQSSGSTKKLKMALALRIVVKYSPRADVITLHHCIIVRTQTRSSAVAATDAHSIPEP